MGTKDSFGTASRWVIASTVAAALASATPLVFAAPVGSARVATSASEPLVAVEVDVAPAIAEAADLRRWVDEEARRTLSALPAEPPRRGSLRIAIGGALYEYQVTVTALRDGVMVGTPEKWGCDCSNGELLEKLRAELPGAAKSLEVNAVKIEPTPRAKAKVEPKSEPVAAVNDAHEPQRGRLGPAGAAGLALMVVGATGVATGITFIVLGDKQLPEREQQHRHRDFRTPGEMTTVGGCGMLVAGALLFFLRKRIDRRQRETLGSLAPSFDSQGRVIFTASGRF